MTQHRNDPDQISNYFDALLSGIGHRGSSFMDADAITHDGKTKRWLVQEFKHEGEQLDKAQHWMLQDLATLPKYFTVAVVVKRHDNMIGFARYFVGRQLQFSIITPQDYQAWFRAWWNGDSYQPIAIQINPAPEVTGKVAARIEQELTADMIRF